MDVSMRNNTLQDNHSSNKSPKTSSNTERRDAVPYIGSKISLISKTDIRYEGILFNIDTNQSTVALQTVRSFGTEGRRQEHIPPSETVYQYATFKAAEIKDLHVCEAAPAVPTSSMINDPAIVSSSIAPSARSLSPPPAPTNITKSPLVKTVQTSSPAVAVDNRKEKVKQETVQSSKSFDKPKQTDQNVLNSNRTANNNNKTNNRTIPGMGNHLLRRKERGVNSDKKPENNKEEFDFEGALNGFKKLTVDGEKEIDYTTNFKIDQEDENVPPIKGSYQKSSFFDTISCDALDRLEGKTGRLKAHEERKLNTETFGATGLNNGFYRRNYRGRGRGRGGYRFPRRNDNSNNTDNNDQNTVRSYRGRGGRYSRGGRGRYYRDSENPNE